MKRLCLLTFIMLLFLAGCGAVRQSEFWQHDTMYKNWAHLRYSWYGYKNPTLETGIESQGQDWWGIPVPEMSVE